MKQIITKSILALAVIITLNVYKASAQVKVTPTTAGVGLFCQGSDLTLPAPTVAGEEWIVKYSEDQTTNPTIGVALTDGTKIPGTALKTGFYYLSSKSNVAGSCESAMQEIPVYVLKPLVVDFAPATFCIEGTPLALKGNVTNPEAPVNLVYQWYTVDAGGVETAISGATAIDFTPTGSLLATGTTKYRLKAGYEINGKKYCAEKSAIKDVIITPKPNKPTITPTQITGTGEVIF